MNRTFAAPIYSTDFFDPADKARHDKIVKLVETILELHKKLAAARTEDDRTSGKRGQLIVAVHRIA